MKIKLFSDSIYEQNSYLIESKEKGIIIDPGMNGKDILEYIDLNHISIIAILLTHGHFDHIRDIRLLTKDNNIPIYIHLNEIDLINQNSFTYANHYRDSFVLKKNQEIHAFSDRDILQFDDLIFRVYHTPGHTTGSSIFELNQNLFVGDTLFPQGIARTDLFTGSLKELRNSLTLIFKTFSQNTTIYPGHNQIIKLKDISKILP